jgi:tripartite-type tricarboxylate transporter receptor subunit TctC
MRSSLGTLAIVALLATPALPAANAFAQSWPAKPVRVIVAFTAGGTTDLLARSVGQQLAERFKQPFVVDNRPGAGGNIGTELAARAPADGYTLIVDSVGPIAVNPTLYKKLAIDPLTDLVPVVQIANVPNVLVVPAALGVTTLDELIARGKAQANLYSYGSTGIGTSSHLSGYMLAKRAGFEATHVPYKGADAVRDLLAGRIQFMFATIPSVIAYIQSGALRALAVTSLQRSRSLPDVPTVADSGFPGFEAGSWFGFFAPKGTPVEVVSTLSRAVDEIVKQPSVDSQMVREGADPVGGSSEQFAQFVQREFEKWRAIVRESGATAE